MCQLLHRSRVGGVRFQPTPGDAVTSQVARRCRGGTRAAISKNIMRQQVLEVSTEVFRVLRKKVPAFVAWADEKPGPTQRILIGDEAYTELIDLAIAKRKTLEEIFRELCQKN
jgi:hypothetical protein